jgi:non-specific serine/threonine protein kinase
MRAAFAEAAGSYEDLGDHRFVLVAHSDLAHGLRRAGELDEAEALLRETIPGWVHLGNRAAVANQLESFAFIALARGDPTRAARLLGSAEELREAADAMMLPHERVEYEAALGRLRGSMDPRALDDAWRAGRSSPMAAAVAMAIGG